MRETELNGNMMFFLFLAKLFMDYFIQQLKKKFLHQKKFHGLKKRKVTSVFLDVVKRSRNILDENMSRQPAKQNMQLD